MLKWGSKMRPPFLNDMNLEKGGGTDHKGSPPESLRLSSTGGIGGFVPVKKHARSSLKGGGGFPCRALMIRAVPNISVPCRAWYQDLGTKKNGELERRSLSKICEGAQEGCRPPARGSRGLEAAQELQEVWGAAAPQ